MNNMLTYAQTEFTPLTAKNLGEIDSLILSWMSYLYYDCIPDIETDTLTVRDLYRAELFEALTGRVYDSENTLKLLAAICASPRFRNITLMKFVRDTISTDSITKQFAAITLRIAPDVHYVSFRGTDATFTGWKEDFELALEAEVPAQTDAKNYLAQIASETVGTLFIGGHSKGGNLAVYAAAEAAPDIRARFAAVYSHDGPGFPEDTLAREGFRTLRPLIHKTIPESSVIGLIMAQEADYEIIDTRAIGLAQHDPFTWKAENGTLVRTDKLTPDSVLIYKKINAWLRGLSLADKKKFIDAVFDVLDATGATCFEELSQDLPHNIPTIVRTLSGMEKEMQQFLLHTIGQLISADTRGENKEANEAPRKLIEKVQTLLQPKTTSDA